MKGLPKALNSIYSPQQVCVWWLKQIRHFVSPRTFLNTANNPMKLRSIWHSIPRAFTLRIWLIGCIIQNCHCSWHAVYMPIWCRWDLAVPVVDHWTFQFVLQATFGGQKSLTWIHITAATRLWWPQPLCAPPFFRSALLASLPPR